MIPFLLKLNEDSVKKVQKVLDKYEIDFDYLKYLQKSSKDFLTNKDWYYGFEETEINLNKIKNYEKYAPLNLPPHTSFIQISDGNINYVVLPQIEMTTCVVALLDYKEINSVDELDYYLDLFFKRMDKYLNLCKTEEYQNICKTLKEKENIFEQMIENRDELIKKSFNEVQKLEKINDDF